MKEPWKPTTNVPLPHRRLELKDKEGRETRGWHDGVQFYPVGVEVIEWRYKRFETPR